MKTILWTHIATTGLDPQEDAILELYMKATDAHGQDIGGVERVFYSGVPVRVHQMEPEVERLHDRSGLLDDVASPTFLHFISNESLDDQIVDCLDSLDGEIVLAGYAPRFTYEFLRHATPRSHAKLHFQQLDVTSIETFMDTAFQTRVYPRPEALRVRAKVDAALEQYVTYMEVLREFIK